MIRDKLAKTARTWAGLGAVLLPCLLADGASAAGTGADWPSFFGNSQAQSFSPLDQINAGNVKSLGVAWAFSTGETQLGATPLVVDGIMYLLAPNNHLFALDAATGRQIWASTREVPSGTLGGLGSSTGIAMADGLIFEGTRDNHLVAVDAKTGRDVWDIQIEEDRKSVV